MQSRRIVLGQRPVLLLLAMVCLVLASLLPSACAFFLLPSLPTAGFSSSSFSSSSVSSVNSTFSVRREVVLFLSEEKLFSLWLVEEGAQKGDRKMCVCDT